MSNIVRYILIISLFLLLFVVRGFATDLFYDPLITYFQDDYLHKTIPKINKWYLIVNMLFRYSINTIISLGIIQLIFKKKGYTKFAGFIYILAFMILILIFLFLLKDNFKYGYLFPFYIRRFIIHPLFLLLLIPSFYYQQLNKK